MLRLWCRKTTLSLKQPLKLAQVILHLWHVLLFISLVPYMALSTNVHKSFVCVCMFNR